MKRHDPSRRRLLGLAPTAMAFGLPSCIQRQQGSKALRLLGEDSSNVAAIKQYLREEKNPTVVEAADFATATQKASADFASKAGYYDVVLQYNFSLAPFTRSRNIFTLAELKESAGQQRTAYDSIESDLLPNVWRELSYYAKPPFDSFTDVEAVGYPFAANTMVLACNGQYFQDTKLARRHGELHGTPLAPPTTWKDFFRLAKFFSVERSGGKGVVLQGATDGWLYYEWANLLFGMGGSVMKKQFGWQSDTTTPLTLVSTEANQAADLYVQLKPYNSGDFFSVDATAQKEAMRAGKAAMAIMWTDYVPDLVKSNPDQYSFHPVPGAKSMIAGGTFFVNRRSKSPGQAFKQICSLLDSTAQRRLALAGLLPPTRSALSDPEVLKLPYMPAVKTSLERGVYMLEAGPDSEIISREISAALQRAWQGKIAAQQVPSIAQAAILAARLQHAR